MATTAQVQQYLAFWFQLGKPLIMDDGAKLLPETVYLGDRYSPAFEACWQRVTERQGTNCYLDGTIATVADLLSERWDILSCYRCDMPVPMLRLGTQDNSCPCSDLPDWPNTELPQPRMPVSSRDRLALIRARLQ
jgi:hypothetical protein